MIQPFRVVVVTQSDGELPPLVVANRWKVAAELAGAGLRRFSGGEQLAIHARDAVGHAIEREQLGVAVA